MAGERAKKEYVWTPIFVTREPHHGLVESYPPVYLGPNRVVLEMIHGQNTDSSIRGTRAHNYCLPCYLHTPTEPRGKIYSHTNNNLRFLKTVDLSTESILGQDHL
jgi:hypothetical protein